MLLIQNAFSIIDGRPPKDSITRITEVIFASLDVYIGCCTAASLGIALTLVFLIINIKYKSVKWVDPNKPLFLCPARELLNAGYIFTWFVILC